MMIEFRQPKTEFAGWIAIYNRKQLEIKVDVDAKDAYSAKLFALKHFKVPKSKEWMLAIAPAYEEEE